MSTELELEFENSSGSGDCWPYGTESYVAVAALSAGLAFISILLILTVIFIMVIFKKLRFFSQRLILYLAITAILVNVGIILHRVDYLNQTTDFYVRFCEFGGYLDLTSNWMLLIAVSCIIAYSTIAIFFSKSAEKYELLYLFLIFIFPLFFTWIPFIKNTYGRAGAWCWIKSEERDANCTTNIFGSWLQYTLWFVPLYVFLIVLIILYIMILIKLYRRKKNWPLKTDKVHIKRDLVPLIAYPLIFFLLNIIPFINRTYNSLNEQPLLGLWFLAAMSNPSVGAWIALACALDPETRKRLTIPQLQMATMELFKKSTVVQEYTVEESKKTESYKITDNHPYKSYEDNYKLNLSSSRNEDLAQ